MAPPELRYVDAFDPTPFYFSNLKSEPFRKAVWAMYEKYQPEMTQVEYLNMTEYAEGMKGVRILRAHVQDWWHFYLGWKLCLSKREQLTKLLGCFDTVIHNRRMMRQFDHILVTHDDERQHALEIVPDANVEAPPFLLMDLRAVYALAAYSPGAADHLCRFPAAHPERRGVALVHRESLSFGKAERAGSTACGGGFGSLQRYEGFDARSWGRVSRVCGRLARGVRSYARLHHADHSRAAASATKVLEA